MSRPTYSKEAKMTNELLNDDSITIDNDHVDNDAVSETDNIGADLATAPEEKQDKNNDGAQKAINKQHAKYREEERKRIATEKERDDLKSKLTALEHEKQDVSIPEIPDPYEDDYEERLKVRDDAIVRKANHDAQNQRVIDQQNATQEAATKAEDERVGTLISGYSKRIGELGLGADDVRLAGDTVVRNGIDGQVAEFILGDEDGPLITKYLADNPIIQDDLRGLTTIQAAMKINSEIRSAASAMKPQASNAPDPTEILSGRGAGEKDSPFISGATFD